MAQCCVKKCKILSNQHLTLITRYFFADAALNTFFRNCLGVGMQINVMHLHTHTHIHAFAHINGLHGDLQLLRLPIDINNNKNSSLATAVDIKCGNFYSYF